MSGDIRLMTVRGRTGFTLIEMLVVIAIILLLVALTVTVGRGVLRQSEVRETENTLRLLDLAVQEWELSLDRQLMYGKNDEPCYDERDERDERYELQQDFSWNHTWGNEASAVRDAEWTTDRMWAIFSRTPGVREVITRVNPAYVAALNDDGAVDERVQMHGNDMPNGLQPSFRFLDAWDRPIIAVLPGRRYNRSCDGSNYTVGNNERHDADGTIRTPFENRFGVAADRRIYFVSAGPDGVFGDLRLDRSIAEVLEADARAAQDNIYSYPVVIDGARPTE